VIELGVLSETLRFKRNLCPSRATAYWFIQVLCSGVNRALVAKSARGTPNSHVTPKFTGTAMSVPSGAR